MECPLKAHALETGEGIAVSVEGEELYLLYFFYVHHSRFGGDGDFVYFPDSDRYVHQGLTGGIFGGEVYGRGNWAELGN
jgi:hypothetical protein